MNSSVLARETTVVVLRRLTEAAAPRVFFYRDRAEARFPLVYSSHHTLRGSIVHKCATPATAVAQTTCSLAAACGCRPPPPHRLHPTGGRGCRSPTSSISMPSKSLPLPLRSVTVSDHGGCRCRRRRQASRCSATSTSSDRCRTAPSAPGRGRTGPSCCFGSAECPPSWCPPPRPPRR